MRIKVMPKKALYWFGNECIEVTGGWTYSALIDSNGYNFTDRGSMTKTKNNIYGTVADTSTSTSYYTSMNTKNMVPIKGIYKSCGVVTATNTTGGRVHACFYTKKKVSWYPAEGRFLLVRIGNTDSDNVRLVRESSELDDSELNYIVAAVGSDYTARTGTISSTLYALWKERE